jgi:hypothetical protein
MRLAGRSLREIVFRLRQALENVAIYTFPPGISKSLSPVGLNLPEPEKMSRLLKDSPFQQELAALADDILWHRLPLLGTTLELGSHIEWRRDYRHGKMSGTGYFRFIPYLNFDVVGDHKNIWEMNRHQHLVVLAQAYLLTGGTAYLEEIGAALESWWEQNPFLRGINWTSALEVAFRALSWLWIDHLIGESLAEGLRWRIWNSLHQHGAFLACNLSTYFSPNTHLLGEGVALHAIGVRLNQQSWRALGARVVDEELVRQVAEDGSHYEQSTYYHVYALDFFLLHYLLTGRPSSYDSVLRKMGRFLEAITGPERLLTFFGDDDGGRLFHPYGPRELFARATLATCSVLFPEEGFPREQEDLAVQASWWLGCEDPGGVPSRSVMRLFPDSGLASIATGGWHVLVDAGKFGFGGAGHSHADTLSVTVRAGSRELLIDPGTFAYVSDTQLRDLFRGTGFHNTIRIDGRDQADPAGPFRWENKPTVQVSAWEVVDGLAYLDARCDYRGFTHRRRVLCLGAEWLLILDEVTGPAGEHQIEQFWHLGNPDVSILLSEREGAQREEGLRSRVLGQKEVASVIRVARNSALPFVCGAALPMDGREAGGLLERNGLVLTVPGRITADFSGSGMPSVTRT